VHDDIGHETLLYFPVPSGDGEAEQVRRLVFEQEQTEPRLGEDGSRVFCARVAGAPAPLSGGELSVAILPESLAFFDLTGGERLTTARVLVS
jgi:hypothetical protein